MQESLSPSLFAFVGAAAITGVATPFVAQLARRAGVVDRPGGRRVHTEPTPRLGGVAVALGLLAGALTYGLIFGLDALLAILSRDELLSFLLPCLLVFLVGLVDDLRGLSPGSRVAAEAVAASFLIQGGYVIDNVANPFGEPIALGLFAFPITVAWLVGVTNAFNLIDGLDGLLGSVSLVALLGVAAVALLGARPASALLAAALAGSVLGFLLWNWNPAKIFMGDSGSLLIGFAIAGLSIKVSRNHVGVGTLAFHVPLLLCGLPIAETLLTLARRHISGRPYFSGDRSHIHHVLLNKGLAVPQAVKALAGVAGLLATVAVLSRDWREHTFFVGALVALGLAVLALRWLGYLELRVLATRVGDVFRQRRTELARAVTVATAGQAISRASTLEDVAQSLRTFAIDCRLPMLALVFTPSMGEALGVTARLTSHEVAGGLPVTERDPLWLFGTGDGTDEGTVTIEVPLVSSGAGLRIGRLVCQRSLGQGPSEREVAESLAAPLAERLGRVLEHSTLVA